MTDLLVQALREDEALAANNEWRVRVCNIAANRIEELERALRVAAGYISTKEGHNDQHPQDVYDWIIQATVEKKND